jgi:hypothetical protein
MTCDEVGIDTILENPEAELLQARDLGLSEVCVSELREGRTSPKSKRLGEHGGGEVCVTVRKRAPASIRQILESMEIEIARLIREAIATCRRFQARSVPERLA